MAKDGRKVVTTAGTRVSLGVSVDGASAVVITAETDNTDVVVVGGPTVVASPPGAGRRCTRARRWSCRSPIRATRASGSTR